MSYDHRTEYTKYTSMSEIDRAAMALKSFQRIETMDKIIESKNQQLNEAIDKIGRLQTET